MNHTSHVGYFADGVFHRPLHFDTLRWKPLYVACHIGLYGRLPTT